MCMGPGQGLAEKTRRAPAIELHLRSRTELSLNRQLFSCQFRKLANEIECFLSRLIIYDLDRKASMHEDVISGVGVRCQVNRNLPRDAKHVNRGKSVRFELRDLRRYGLAHGIPLP